MLWSSLSRERGTEVVTQKVYSYYQESDFHDPGCSVFTQESHTSPLDIQGCTHRWNLYSAGKVWKAIILLLSHVSTSKTLQMRVPLSAAFLHLLSHGQLWFSDMLCFFFFFLPPCFSLLLCLSHRENSPSSSDHTHLGDAVENRPFVSVWRMLSLTCQRTYFTWWERILGQIPPYCKQTDRSGLTLGLSMAYFGQWKVSSANNTYCLQCIGCFYCSFKWWWMFIPNNANRKSFVCEGLILRSLFGIYWS